MQLSPDQKNLLRQVWRWFISQKSPYLTFGGYAGTGKTTMIAFLRKALQKKFPKLKVGFCAYTGKAARVLEGALSDQKANFPQDSSGTIHSLIYEPQIDEKGRITGWKRKESLKASLIIVDEASMVDQQIWRDLTSFKLPILAVGDHGQLPPIRGNFNLMEKPQLRLEKIHRQAKNNPIIRLSERVRQGEKIPFGDFGPVKKLSRTDDQTRELAEELLQNYSSDLLVLVGYNLSRVKLNSEIRKLNDIMEIQPQKGEQIICLKNNYQKGIYNGLLGKIKEITESKKNKRLWYHLEAEMADGHFYQGRVLKQQFNSLKTIDHLPGLSYKKMGDLFDFGYVLTVHKAQGSQAKKVLLFEERFRKMTDQDWRRWLYTAVTRAEEELIIIG